MDTELDKNTKLKKNKFYYSDGVMDIHWAPYYVDCSPCLVKYDWIIKLEDINRNELEEELLLRSIHKKGF